MSMVKKTFYLALSLIGVIFLSLVGLFLSQRSDINVTPITDCLSDSKVTVYCEFSKPEDIVVLPDNRHLLISEFGAITPLSPENLPGQISLFDTDLLKSLWVITIGVKKVANETTWCSLLMELTLIKGRMVVINWLSLIICLGRL